MEAEDRGHTPELSAMRAAAGRNLRHLLNESALRAAQGRWGHVAPPSQNARGAMDAIAKENIRSDGDYRFTDLRSHGYGDRLRDVAQRAASGQLHDDEEELPLPPLVTAPPSEPSPPTPVRAPSLYPVGGGGTGGESDVLGWALVAAGALCGFVVPMARV